MTAQNVVIKRHSTKARTVMANHLGRNLDPRETVKHKYGDITDNSIENLELWPVDIRPPAGFRAYDIALDRANKLSPEDKARLIEELSA